MKKIPTVFVRDRATGQVTGDVTPGCEWVLTGEGSPTVKVDGTCVMLDAGGAWWARREVKRDRTPPPGWVEVDADPDTGKRFGWEPIEQSGFVKMWREAVGPDGMEPAWDPGTYELCGPKINENPEGLPCHALIRHGSHDFSVLREYRGEQMDSPANAIRVAARHRWEGIVWHHPDGRAAKLKVRDYPPGALLPPAEGNNYPKETR